MRVRLGKKTETILLCLVGSVYITAQLLDMMFMGGRSGSYKRAYGKLYGGYTLPEKTDAVFEDKQQFYSLLNSLKRQGLIEKKKSKKGVIWKITSAGLQKLKLFKERKIEYDIIQDNKLKIIAYDIPEREKKKREWLREVLRMLGFRMLQRSLWIGKNKVPERFLKDLREKNIINYVDIFEISQKGTIREIT